MKRRLWLAPIMLVMLAAPASAISDNVTLSNMETNENRVIIPMWLANTTQARVSHIMS
jgi:hypothetical protein